VTESAAPVPVVYIIAALVSGGAERQLWLLLRELDRQRFAPHLLAYVDGRWRGRFESLDIPVEVVGRRGRIEEVVATWRRLRQIRPVIVHTYGHTANYVGRVAAIAARVPFIVASERSSPAAKRRYATIADRLLAPFTSHLVTNSEHAARSYVQRRILPAAKVSAIKNGVDPAPGDPRLAGRRLVTLTDFRPVKNHVPLLGALEHLAAELPDVELHFLGEGEGRAAAQDEARRRGLGDRAVFRGYVGDVVSVLLEANVYVHTARYEGLPNGVMEAMACGLPCVVFDAAGCLELVEDGVTGFVVPMDDEVALTDAVRRLLTEQDLARTMGDRGRERVTQELGVTRMVEETLRVYDGAYRAGRVPRQ
jgi:glycosyltransferase involved in cell wall biosynthesis